METLERPPRLKRQHDLHKIQFDEIIAWRDIPVIGIESHYQCVMYTVVFSIIALQTILALTMILYHCRASGTYKRPAKSKSPKNIFKYTTVSMVDDSFSRAEQRLNATNQTHRAWTDPPIQSIASTTNDVCPHFNPWSNLHRMSVTNLAREAWTDPPIQSIASTTNDVCTHFNPWSNLHRMSATNLAREAWTDPPIQSIASTTNDVCTHFNPWSNLHRMSATNLAREAWTDPPIQSIASTTNDVCTHFNPWSNLHRMSATNLAREAWTDPPIQSIASTTNDVCPHFNPWSNLHRMSATNLAREAWTDPPIQSIASTTNDVCTHFNPWSNLHRMSATNLAREAWTDPPIQSIASKTNDVCPHFNPWSNLHRMSATNLAREAWTDPPIQSIASTTNDVCTHFNPWSNLHRMSATNLAREAWTDPPIQSIASATNDVCPHFNPWSNLHRMSATNLAREAWTDPPIQSIASTTNDVCTHFNPWSNLHRMSATNLAREAWTDPPIQSIAATTNDVCPHFNPWSNLHRMNVTNLARVECSEHTIQNNAAIIGIFPVYNRWNILQRMNGTNLAHVAWNEYTIQNIVATTPVASPLILPDSLNQFLDLSQRRHSYNMVQIMSYEMMRLHSFKREFPISAIRLAQSGFFATGVVYEVKCFSCGVYYRNWQPTDIPHLLHERLSPNCRMVLGSEANNRPIQRFQNTLQSGILCAEYSANDMSHAVQKYKMDAILRGRAVIINNEFFTNNPNETPSRSLGNRSGTQIDAERLKILWRNLRFEVDFHENKTAEEMRHIAVNTARINHSEYDCLVFCILTHGGDCGILYGTDGRTLHIHKITELFHSNQCPNLAGKPKLFFIQACQGVLNQTGLVVFTDANNNPAEIPANSNSENRLAEIIPNGADFLISYATVPGYVSFRCPINGTWYIRNLVKNLKKFAQMYDLMTILSLVNLDVGKDETNEGDITYKQIPIHMTTLRKEVHFS